MTTRFNEAPIHESGKFRSARAWSLRGPCFNEAPIHESGKSDARRRERGACAVASMRPRFMNRGSDAPLVIIRAKSQLLQ